MANRVPFYYDPEEFKNWVHYSEKCGELELEVLKLTSIVEVMEMEINKLEQSKSQLLTLIESKDDELLESKQMLSEDMREALRLETEALMAERVRLKVRITELEEEVAILEEDNSYLQHDSPKEEETVDADKLEELQSIIGEVTSNWRLAVADQKTIAEELAIVRVEATETQIRLKAYEEKERAREEELTRLRTERETEKESIVEIPRLQLQIRQLAEENKSLRKILTEKTESVEKTQSDIRFLSSELKLMRKSQVKSTSAIEESPSSKQVDPSLHISRYELVKERYEALQEKLQGTLEVISQFSDSLASIKVTQQRLSREVQEYQFEGETEAKRNSTLLAMATSLQRFTREAEEIKTNMDELKKKIQEKDNFEAMPDDDFSPIPSKSPDEMSLRTRIFSLECENFRLRTDVADLQSRLSVLDQVESLLSTLDSDPSEALRAAKEAITGDISAGFREFPSKDEKDMYKRSSSDLI